MSIDSQGPSRRWPRPMWVMPSLVLVVVWAGLSLEPLLGDGILYSRDLGRWQAGIMVGGIALFAAIAGLVIGHRRNDPR